jgi:hypothetical protein
MLSARGSIQTVENKDLDIGSGQAIFKDIKLPMGLRVDEIRLNLEHARIRHDPMRIELDKPAGVQARITEANLAAFLEEQAPGGLRSFEVELANGTIRASATAQVVIPIRGMAICTLEVKNEAQLFVRLESISPPVGIARNMFEAQLEKINPVLDVQELPLKVRLLGTQIDNGLLVLRAEAMPPQAGS